MRSYPLWDQLRKCRTTYLMTSSARARRSPAWQGPVSGPIRNGVAPIVNALDQPGIGGQGRVVGITQGWKPLDLM
jgi:hypothetical protein